MESRQLSRAEALACTDCRHACHVMLYSDTKSQLFGKIPIRHIVLMQMRFDGLLGFPGGLVDPSQETLEAGLTRELLEEIGVAVPVSEEDHVESRFAPPISAAHSHLITHFYVKKMEEEQIKELEKASASTAVDHGLEVLGMVRVPLYTSKRGGGLSFFLSHSFIGNARTQLINSLLRLHLVTSRELRKALGNSLKMHAVCTGPEGSLCADRGVGESALKHTCAGCSIPSSTDTVHPSASHLSNTQKHTLAC